MERADCSRLESEFQVRLPELLISLLIDYPRELRDLVRGDGIPISDSEFADNVEQLLLMNREVRLEPIVDGDGMVFDWPNCLLVIGENGSGDYYCIDTDDAESGVLFFDHQLCEIGELGEDLIGFVELLCEQYNDNNDNPTA